MKIIGVGDLLIPEEMIREGFEDLADEQIELETISWEMPDYETLQAVNLQVETEGCESVDVPEEMLESLKDADILITQFFPVNRQVIDACPNLKVIGVLRGGIENVNEDYAKEKGILIYHTPGRNANAVADFTVGMLLAECRNIARSHRNLKEGKWVRDYTNAGAVPDLADKTVGIAGFGEIGKKVAKRLSAFDMDVLVYDPYAKDIPEGYRRAETLDELAEESDFVTLHMRLTDETSRIINEEFFSRMKPGAYLINTARSGLVDETALAEALSSGKIMGAAIDVFDHEPPDMDDPLLNLPNLTITPHLAGGTVDAFLGSPKLLAREMKGLFEGKPSRFVVNPENFDIVSSATGKNLH